MTCTPKNLKSSTSSDGTVIELVVATASGRHEGHEVDG